MTLIYATPDDYEAGPPERTAPDNAPTLLWYASLLIAGETVADRYTTDSDGYPLDTALRDAFRQATCAQASVWAGLGVDPSLAGLDVGSKVIRGKGIGSARIDYDTSISASVTGFQARQQLITDLAPIAQRILVAAGLLSGRIGSY